MSSIFEHFKDRDPDTRKLASQLKRKARAKKKTPAPSRGAEAKPKPVPQEENHGLLPGGNQGVPVERLVPKPEEEEIDEDDIDYASTGSPIASSAHASMHLYFLGTRLMNNGRYDEAVSAFRKFLEESPDHVYADHAQYLIAEAHFKNHEYGLSIVASNVLETQYPNSFKIPEALYYRAQAYLKMGQTEDARAVLRQLILRYPEDTLADSASKQIVDLASKNSTRSASITPELDDNNPW